MHLEGIEIVRDDPPDVCVWQRGKTNKQCCVFCIERQYPSMPLSPSFFVFIPPSISKTWLKCSSYRRLCWTTWKQTVRWEEKWSGKVKSIFYGVTLFILHRRREEKNTDVQTFLSSLPLSLSPILLSSQKAPWYLRTTSWHHKLNSLPRTIFHSQFFRTLI